MRCYYFVVWRGSLKKTRFVDHAKGGFDETSRCCICRSLPGRLAPTIFIMPKDKWHNFSQSLALSSDPISIPVLLTYSEKPSRQVEMMMDLRRTTRFYSQRLWPRTWWRLMELQQQLPYLSYMNMMEILLY